MIVQTTLGPKLSSLLRLAASVRHVAGDAAECGVLQGGSLRALALTLPNKRVLGFDTFNGLPAESWSDGEPHKVGEFAETSFELVARHVASLPNVVLVPGVFPQACSPFAESKFAFVYIDFDFYRSTLAAIDWFYPRMTVGGIMVFDDYDWHMCPGVRRAIEQRGLAVTVQCAYQAVHRIGAAAST